MIAQKLRRVAFIAFITLSTLTLLGTQSPFAMALSSDQQKAFNENVRYFNTDLCGTNSGTTDSPTIVIDPGHSGEYGKEGESIRSVDAATGLDDYDYPNKYENEEMFYVALKAKKALSDAGYGVVLTKGDEIPTNVTSVNDAGVQRGAKLKASLRQRATVANSANANLAISLHDDHSASWDTFARIYVQKVGLYRTGTQGKVTFNDTAVAAKSQKYGDIFASTRTQAEGHNASVTGISFDNRDGIDPGNIPMVELFAQVPWVYNEVGAPANGYLSQANLDKYVTGLVNGVKQSIPITASTSNNLSGKDNPMKAMNYLISHGLTKDQAAGIVGNLMVESYDQLKTDAQNGDAYGIAQWLGSRHDALAAFAKSKGKPIDDLGVQLDYLWSELTGPYQESTLAPLKTASTADAAAKVFFDNFEKANDDSLPKRQSNAEKVLAVYQKEYADGTVATTSTSSSASTSCTSASGNSVVNCTDPTLSDLSQTRQNVVCLAQQEYAKWKSGQMKRGTDFHKYSQGVTEAWCADFASWIYNQAGYPLDPSHWRQAAVESLISIGKKGGRFQYHSSSNYTPKPGDMMIWNEGDHVNLVTAVKGNKVTIIGGNQDASVSGANGTASAVTSYDTTVGGISGGQRNTSFVSPD